MAEPGRPLLEMFPAGGGIPCDSALPNVPALPVSKSPAEMAKTPLQPKEFQKHASNAPRSEKVLEDSSNVKPNTAAHMMVCAGDCMAVRAICPHSIAEVHRPDGAGALRGDRDSVTHQNEKGFGANVSSVHRDLGERSPGPARLPDQRSLSDNLQTRKGGPASVLPCETRGPVCMGRSLETSNQPLACMQAMQLHQSSTSSVFCREGMCSGSSAQRGCSHSAGAGSQAAGEPSGDMKHSRLEEAVCCSSYPRVAVEGTFAAYCHPQPIPAPSPASILASIPAPSPARLPLQRAPPEGPEGNCRGQGVGPTLLTLPPLVSSVSETGLDGKHLLHCCSLDCDWPGPLRRQQRAGHQAGATRDAATMTSRMELRDAGVQVGQERPETQAQHVFPEVCLLDEGAHRKSPVREVSWDAEGMTWEVYGASVDPEELGLAIQKHLELQIKETAGRAARLSRQSTVTSHASAGKGRHRRRSLIPSLRPPGCCTRTTTAAD